MSCEESKQLTVGILTNRAANELLSKFAKGIENAANIKDVTYRRQVVQAYEELAEITTMSALANENPIYRETLIKRAKALDRTADMAQIIDGIDNLPDLQNDIVNAGLSIAKLKEKIQEKIVRDFVLVKDKGINALLRGEYKGKTLQDIVGKKKLMKLSVQELKDELNINDAYFSILEETDNAKRLTEYVVNRELLGPVDESIFKGLPSLPVKNKITNKELKDLIKKATDEQMYDVVTLYGRNIVQDKELIAAVKARKGATEYDKIVSFLADAAKTSKTIGDFNVSVSQYMRQFIETSIKGMSEYKAVLKEYPTLKGRLSAIAKDAKSVDGVVEEIAKVKKDFERLMDDEVEGKTNKLRNKVIALTSQGGLTAKKVTFFDTRSEYKKLTPEHLALANVYEQYYRQGAMTLGDIDTIDTIEAAKKILEEKDQYILVQNVVQYNNIYPLLTESERARVIFPRMGQDLGYFTDGGKLYVGGKPYAKDIIRKNINYLGIEPQIFGADFDGAWSDFVKVRAGDLDEKTMNALGSAEDFIENDKLVLNTLGNRIADIVDVSSAREEFSQLDVQQLTAYAQTIIKQNFDEETAAALINKLDIGDVEDFRTTLYNYKYASSPESSWKALQSITDDASLSNNPGVIAINMLNELQDAGYSLPGYSTLHAFVESKLTGKATSASKQFVEDFVARNPIEGASTFVDVKKQVTDQLEAIYDKSKKSTSTYVYKETPKEGVAKVFVEFDGGILSAVRGDIAERSQRVTIETLGREVNDDLAGMNKIIDDYTKKAQASIGKGDGVLWRLKEEAATAVKEYEDYLTNKYMPLLDNERQLRTSKYNLVKISGEADVPLLISEGDKIKATMEERLSRVFTAQDYNVNSFKDGVFVGGYKDMLRNIDGLNADLRGLLNKIDVEVLSQSEARKLFNFFNANKYALNNTSNRYVLAYDTIFPGMKDFFRDYEVVVTEAGELPYRLSVETVAGVGQKLDKEVKADIFNAVSKQIKGGKPLDSKLLGDIVETSLQKNILGNEFKDAYVQMFSPYYKLYKLPQEIVDSLPKIVPMDGETRKLLEGIDYNGDDGLQSLAYYFDRTPDTVVPQVLKEKNVFAVADEPTAVALVDDYKRYDAAVKELSTRSIELDSKANSFSVTSGIGILKKYLPKNKKLGKIVELVDRLVPKSKAATESLENITSDNLVKIQSSLKQFMSMGDQQFIEAKLQRLSNEEANAYRIADFFRTMSKGSKGLTGTPYDDVMANAWRFIAEDIGTEDVVSRTVGFNGSSRFRAFKRSVSGSRIFGITGVDFGSDAFTKFLEQNKTKIQVDVPYGATPLYKQEIKGGIAAIKRGDVADATMLENVNKLLGVTMTQEDAYKLLAALDHTDREASEFVVKASKWFNNRTLKLMVGGTQMLEGLAALPQNVAGFLNRSSILSRGLGAKDSQLALAREMMEKYKLVNVNIPGLNDIRGALSDAGASLYAKIRRKLPTDEIPVGISDINNPSVRNIITETVEAAGMSIQNGLDIIFSDDARAKHLFGAVKQRGFSSMEDLGYVLSKLPEAEGKNLIDEINAIATRTYSADIAMPSADLYKQGKMAGNIPYLSKGLSYGYEYGVALPFGWKASWGNTSAAQFFRRFAQTGNIAHYLTKNGFSEAAKQEVVKWVLNNPEYTNFMQQLGYSAVNIQRYKRLVGDQDDWSTVDQGEVSDYLNALKALVMPIQGVASSSLWRAFGDVIGADDKTAVLMSSFARAYSQVGYLKSATYIAQATIDGGPVAGFEEFMKQVHKIGGAGVRYLLDDMEQSLMNNYAPSNPQLGRAAIVIGDTTSDTKKIRDYLYNAKLSASIEEKGLFRTLRENVIKGGIVGQSAELLWGFLAGNTGLIDKPSSLLGIRGSKDKLFGILKDEPLLQTIDETGVLNIEKLRQNRPAYREFMDSLQYKIAFGTKPYDHFTDGIDYFLDGAEVKDDDLYVMFKVIADAEGQDYLQGLKDRLGGRQTNDQKLQTLGNIYAELSDKGYEIPGLNNQVAQYKAKLLYDKEFDAAETARNKQNKSIYGKANATSFPREQKQALQDKYSETYLNEIKNFDWTAYQGLLLDGVALAGADKLGDYIKVSVDEKTKEKYVTLLPKRKRLMQKDMDIRRAVANGDVHNLSLRMNNLYTSVIDSPEISDQTRILMVKSLQDYYDQQDNLTDAEKFAVKSDILIATKNLIGKANKIKDLMGVDYYNAFVESYYGTKLQGDKVIEDMKSALNDDGTIGGGKGKKTNFGKMDKPNATMAKLVENQKILRDNVNANIDIFKNVKSVTPASATFGYERGKPNKSPKPFESAGISSSISKVSLGDKVAKQAKDIKRIYSVKKVKGTPKKKTA